MALAYKCDLCGTLYQAYKGVPYDKHGNYYTMVCLWDYLGTRRNFDICPDCMHAVINFLHSRVNVTQDKEDIRFELGKLYKREGRN